jgi:hypothetical protein
MRYLPIFLSSIAAIATYLPSPVKAQFKPYQVVSGKESIELDSDAIATLESIGLSIESIDNTANPAPGYDFAWSLLPPPTKEGDRGTTFQFLYDEQTDAFAPLSGTTELTGSFLFDVDQTKLNLGSQLQLGDLSVSFDPNLGFVATDTATTNLPIFTVNTFSVPSVNLSQQTWFLEPIDIVFTQEFSDFLVAAGASQSIAGLKIGEARGDRNFVPVNVPKTPEPVSVLAILLATGAGLLITKRS